jgi:hypothetical protein
MAFRLELDFLVCFRLEERFIGENLGLKLFTIKFIFLEIRASFGIIFLNFQWFQRVIFNLSI